MFINTEKDDVVSSYQEINVTLLSTHIGVYCVCKHRESIDFLFEIVSSTMIVLIMTVLGNFDRLTQVFRFGT